MAFESEEQKIDVRLYIGLLFFRWQIIAVCFLYCLLAGVLYIHLTPKRYRSQCTLMVYRDPNTAVTGENPFGNMNEQRFLLQSPKLRTRVVNRLQDRWSKAMGGRGAMMLPVSVGYGRYMGPTFEISVQCGNPEYGKAFLAALLDEFQNEWNSMQREGVNNTLKLLDKELATLDEKIRSALDDWIEYQRLHDVNRISLKGNLESAQLNMLVSRRHGIMTELMMLETVFPMLKGASEDVIVDVARVTKNIGTAMPAVESRTAAEGAVALESQTDEQSKIEMKLATPEEKTELQSRDWPGLRLQLSRLRLQEKALLDNLEPTHPQVQEVRKQIATIKGQLDLAAEMELAQLRNRQRALQIQLEAIEAAEYKWQAKYYWEAQRMIEGSRYQSTINRYESAYHDLYARRGSLVVSEELKLEHFNVINPPWSNPKPVWPDPMRVLLIAVGAGLAAGFGIALAAHILDNKIQSIADVEKELGVTYLGGVPYWVHSGLEKSIRPIVTEEHSTGAVEAYRALRTTIIAALTKLNEKIFFLTSADSREGKTLTVLNIAIMIAQMNKKVLLIDMDLRRGRLHRSLGLEKEPGVSDVLRGGLQLRDVVHRTKIDHLDFIPVGTPLDDAAELLQSSSLMNMLVDLQNDYDYICCDTSPVLRVTDTVIMTTQGVGVVVYVARVNHTPKPLIRYSLEMLKDARVLGLIMNSIEMHKVSSLYYTYQYPNYAYYSNAYAYGYNYYYYGDGRTAPKRERPPHLRRRTTGRSVSQWFRKTFLPLE